MTWRRRRVRVTVPELRDAGRAAAVGLAPAMPVRDELDLRDRPVERCTYCGASARVDMIDVSEGVAYLTCRVCHRAWETVQADVIA